jgi:acetyl esterase/lipase
MKKKPAKPIQIVLKVLKVIMVIVLLGTLFIFPRIHSLIFPEKPPVGYFGKPPVYLAIYTGLESVIDKTPAVPEGVKEIKNITYKNVNGKDLQLDLYIPENRAQPVPLLVFIHGGGWKSGKRSDYLVYLVAFAQKGYATATVSYRLRNDALYPACAEDIRDAVGWLAEHCREHGYDPSRIALIGGSAGGHLAMLTAYGWKNNLTGFANDSLPNLTPEVKAVVNFYGPYDLTTPFAQSHPLVTGLLGKTWMESAELYREASPKNWLDQDDPPTLIFHGTSDQTVPVSQSDSLYQHLLKLGIPAEYYRLMGWPHTMDLVQRVNNFTQKKMELFFKQFL